MTPSRFFAAILPACASYAPWAIGCAIGWAIGCAARPALAGEQAPLIGCYERVYDAAHLKAHPAQIVRRVRLSIGPTSVSAAPDDTPPVVADAILQIWAGAEKAAFNSIGACSAEDGDLFCNASLSAAETRLCKTREDGVRNCRISMTDAGAFQIAQNPKGALLSVRERLELPGPESGAYLYLGPANMENRAFQLERVGTASCK